MRRFASFSLATSLLVMLFALPGCGDSDDNGTNGTPGGETTTEVIIPSGDCVPATDEDDRTYRITNLNITQPGSLGAIQGLIAADINEGLLDVMVSVRNFEDCGDGVMTFEITGNAGMRHETSEADADPADAVYTWADSLEEVVWRPALMQADRSFQSLESLDIIFPALLPADGPDEEPEELNLPLKGIEITGGFATNDAGVRVIRGASSGGAVLEGAVLAEEVEGIEISLTGDPQPLSNFLGTRSFPQGAALEDRTGWRLRATVIAQEVAFVHRDE